MTRSDWICLLVTIELVSLPLVFWLIMGFVIRKALRELGTRVEPHR